MSNKLNTIGNHTISKTQFLLMQNARRDGGTSEYVAGSWGALFHKGLVKIVKRPNSRALPFVDLTALGNTVLDHTTQQLKAALAAAPGRMQSAWWDESVAEVIPEHGEYKAHRLLQQLGYFEPRYRSLIPTEKLFSTVQSSGFKNRKYID